MADLGLTKCTRQLAQTKTSPAALWRSPTASAPNVRRRYDTRSCQLESPGERGFPTRPGRGSEVDFNEMVSRNWMKASLGDPEKT